MDKTAIITTVNGNVEKLVNIGEVKGNFINNGIIYLNATYEVFQELNEIELTESEFNEFYDKHRLSQRTMRFLVSLAYKPSFENA